MKKMSIRLAALVLPLVVSSVSLAGQQLGDNTTLIVPTGAIQNARQVIVIKGAPSATATKIGSCGDPVKFQDAEVVDRLPPAGGRGPASPQLPTIKTTVAIVVPGVTGYKEFKVGWHMGKLGDKGACGPGYDVKLAHIIAIE